MKLKYKVKRFLRGLIIEKKKISKNSTINNLKLTKGDKRILLFMTPEYGNIGDHAIAYATLDFLKKNTNNQTIIEVTQKQLIYSFNLICRYINKNDLILISGGGYFGDLWFNDGEYLVRKIIKKYSKNKIIILPMTSYFSNTSTGNKELKKSSEIYKKHNNLYIFCREKNTFDLFKKNNFIKNENLFLVPDMVLHLTLEKKHKESKALLCFRNDKEKNINININKLSEYIKKNTGLEIFKTTTRINSEITLEYREKILFDKLEEFLKAKIVITDRLHAMIFSYITCTPCIVLDNISGKISGVYQWIKDSDYIYLAHNYEEIKSYLRKIQNNKIEFLPKDFQKEFFKIIEVIKNENKVT